VVAAVVVVAVAKGHRSLGAVQEMPLQEIH